MEEITKLLEHAEEIQKLTAHLDFNAFQKNPDSAAACFSHLKTMRDIISDLNHEYTDRYPLAPWHELSNLNMFVLHVRPDDLSPLWPLLTQKIPFLVAQLQTEGIPQPETLFSYETTPSFGIMFTIERRILSIARDFTLKDTRRDCNQHLISQTSYDVSPAFVEELEQALETHWDEISSLPSRLHNGSLDGSYYIFRFKEKNISALNIIRTDLEEIKENNPSYYEHYLENMKQENAVLDLFDHMMAVFAQHHVTIPDFSYPSVK